MSELMLCDCRCGQAESCGQCYLADWVQDPHKLWQGLTPAQKSHTLNCLSMPLRNCCMQVGHVEDVVVDDGYRGQKMGQRFVPARLCDAWLLPIPRICTHQCLLYVQGDCCISCVCSKPRMLQSHSGLRRQQCAILWEVWFYKKGSPNGQLHTACCIVADCLPLTSIRATCLYSSLLNLQAMYMTPKEPT